MKLSGGEIVARALVVKTNLLRFPWPDRLRFIGRAVGRKLLSGV